VTRAAKQETERRTERGYAVLMMLFLVATLIVFAAAGTLSTLTEGRRQKEAELAWRGNQYVRAIRLYYRKNGRFPQSIDDLTAYHTDQPRFIRQAYKDPMNDADGSWRLIYVLPNGQLVGSVMHTALQGSLMAGPANPLGNNNSTSGSTGANSSSSGQNAGASGQPQNQQAQNASSGQSASSSTDSSFGSGQVFGGNLIGVASKIKQPSLRVYLGGKTYYQWEFIWDPTASGGQMGGQPANGGQPTNGSTGAPATGSPSSPGQGSSGAGGTGTGGNGSGGPGGQSPNNQF